MMTSPLPSSQISHHILYDGKDHCYLELIPNNEQQAELAAKTAALQTAHDLVAASDAAANEALKQLAAVSEAATAASVEAGIALAAAQAREMNAQMFASQKEQEAVYLALEVEKNAEVSDHFISFWLHN